MGFHSIKFQSNYRLEITSNNDGSQSIVLVRDDGNNDKKIFSLDMSDILRQCEPLYLIEQVISDMGHSLHAATYAFDNYEYKSAKEAIDDYRSNVNQATMQAEGLIRAIAREKVLADAFSLNDTMPF